MPRSTRLGPGSGLWHVIPAGTEKLRVNRRFFKDLAEADNSRAGSPALDAALSGSAADENAPPHGDSNW